MLHTIDTRLILAFDAVAAYLQEKMGVTMALILREISMAMLAGFAFLFYTLAVSGDVVMIGLYLVFGMAGLTRLVAATLSAITGADFLHLLYAKAQIDS